MDGSSSRPSSKNGIWKYPVETLEDGKNATIRRFRVVHGSVRLDIK